LVLKKDNAPQQKSENWGEQSPLNFVNPSSETPQAFIFLQFKLPSHSHNETSEDCYNNTLHEEAVHLCFSSIKAKRKMPMTPAGKGEQTEIKTQKKTRKEN